MVIMTNQQSASISIERNGRQYAVTAMFEGVHIKRMHNAVAAASVQLDIHTYHYDGTEWDIKALESLIDIYESSLTKLEGTSSEHFAVAVALDNPIGGIL